MNLLPNIRIFLNANNDNAKRRVSRTININICFTSTNFTNFKNGRRSSASIVLQNSNFMALFMVTRERIKGSSTVSTTFRTLLTRNFRTRLRSKVRMPRGSRKSTSVTASITRLFRGRTRKRTIIRNTNNNILGSGTINRKIARQGSSFGRTSSISFRNASGINYAIRNKATYAGMGKRRVLKTILRGLIGTIRRAVSVCGFAVCGLLFNYTVCTT